MSTESSPDQDLIDQTRQQIRALVGEIESLARSDVQPAEFYEGFLSRVVSALAAEAGAVWVLGEGGRLELAHQINLRRTKLADRKEDQERHGRLLRKILTSGQGTITPPHSGDGDQTTANPTEYLLVLGPLKSDQETTGVVEVFQRAGGRPTVERGYLRFLMQMCELAGDYLKTHHLRLFTDRQVMWAQLEQFTRLVHQGLDARATAYTIANEGRRLIECDRVTVAIRRGRKCRVEAISGQESFERRSNSVALLDKLASVVVAGGEAVWYSGDTTDLPPQIEETLEQYVDESHTKALAVLPLVRPREENEEKNSPPEFIGALIVEQINDDAISQGMERRIEVVKDHSAAALTNALDHQGLFLMPVWKAIGKSRVLVSARTLPKTILVLLILGGIIGAMFLVPTRFEQEGRGTLEPVLKRDVFATEKATIQQIEPGIEQGAIVQEGAKLITLEDNDLERLIEELIGKIGTTEQNVDSLTRAKNNVSPKPGEAADTTKIDGDLAQAWQELENLRHQLELAQKKAEHLEIHSPITGTVLTWKPRDRLAHRPVERGQSLLRIADPTGPWELELKMPEDRMGHILRAREELQAKNEGPLKVSYILATDPGVTRTGELKEIHSVAEVHGEEGNVVLLRIAIDKADLPPESRPGTSVTAKVDCGEAPLGYWLFHDVIAWYQRNVAFRF